jgi:viroplasmin and RNaseH domain-containing protein
VAMKYYAVKAGYIPGVYETWDECKKQVDGFSGASYKGFSTYQDAVHFLNATDNASFLASNTTKAAHAEAVAYVDGSYDDSIKTFAYGVVIFHNGLEKHFSGKMNDPELIEMRNVAGEIKAAEHAMQFCIDYNIKSIDIYHDYAGIAKWCTGEWKATKKGTKGYKAFYDSIKTKLFVNFIKVKGHSGDKYNDLADQLAKSALTGKTEAGVVEMAKAKSIYLDKTTVDTLVDELGKKMWGGSFQFEPLRQTGIQQRCCFSVDGNKEALDFYFKADGSVTIKSVGASTFYSEKLKDAVIANSFKNEHENSTCTFSQVSEDTFTKLIDYLNSLEKLHIIEDKFIDSPAHRHLKYGSSFGDKMVINRYQTGTLLFQGNPAYILTEAMYFMTLMPDVSEDEISQRQKDIYQAEISPVSKSRANLKSRIPHAYDKLDDTILKILVPSISLSCSNLVVEEYSCCVFPALKALEAFLLDLLYKKGIIVNPPKQNLGSVFVPDAATGCHVLSPSNKTLVNDSTYEKCLEDIYNYFKQQRHTRFHANQVLVLSTMIFNKAEADIIIGDVLRIIDDTASKIL